MIFIIMCISWKNKKSVLSCITYLFIHENKSNRFGRFALCSCVNKTNISC